MSYIVGIEGLRAVGKSTIALEVAKALKADVISLGRIRDMVRDVDQGKTPALYERVTGPADAEEALALLQAQARAIYPFVKSIIDACRKRNASLVLEGAHVFPGLYSDDLDAEFFLVASEEDLARRIRKDEKDRGIPENALAQNFQKQEALKDVALAKGVAVIDTASFASALGSIQGMLPGRKE